MEEPRPEDGPDPSPSRSRRAGTPPPSVPPPYAPPSASPVPDHGSSPADRQAPRLGATSVEVEREGPPPPPFVRARRRRRQRLLLGVAILVVVGTPIGLAIAGQLGEEPADEAAAPTDGTGDGTDDGPGADPDADPDAPDSQDGETPDASLVAPDPAQLEGIDALYGELLIDIDASEQVMLGFQQDLAAAFQGAVPGDPELLTAIGRVAEERRDELLAVRERLADQLDDEGADAVRDRYVEHLDAWADYMGVIAEDPARLAQQDDTGHNVAINATADVFARTLEDELPEGIDEDVERFANGILERGFRSQAEANV